MSNRRIRVVVYLDADQLERLDQIAQEYWPTGPVSRSHELREAVIWLIARRTVWLDRRAMREPLALQRAAAEQRAYDERRLRPGDFDFPDR